MNEKNDVKGRGSRHFRGIGFAFAIVLLGLVGTSAVLALSPAFENETDAFRHAVYDSERTVFTTYFYWYRSAGTLQGSQQVVYDCNTAVIAKIKGNIHNPPADWPGPTLADLGQVISFNATGDGHNYTNAISQHPLAKPPTYNAQGEVTSPLDRSLAKYSNDANGVIVNTTSWFDWMNPVWHEWEMRCMMRAGIDVAMPVYWWTGPDYNAGYWAHEGLVVLNDTITALQGKVAAEQAAGGSYAPGDVPRIAMFYDTTLMRQLWEWNVTQNPGSIYFGNWTKAQNEGPGADLTDPYWMNQFYLRIQEFYDVIANGSAMHTSTIQFGGVPREYCVVWLYSGGYFDEIGQDVLDYCKTQFQARYGKPLLIVGGGEWSEANVDGECGWGACCSPRLATYTRIPVGGYGPGYYNIGTLISQKASYTARDTARYKEGLQSVIDSGAAWIHVETWNELLEGTDVCWTQQYGYDFIDATREVTDRFHAMVGQPPLASRVNFVLVLAPLSGLVVLLGISVMIARRLPVEMI